MYYQNADIATNEHQPEDSVLRARRLKNRQRKLLTLDEKAFAQSSRYLILVLTLGYKKEFRHQITLNDIQRHRNRFFNNARMNSLLNDIEAYIWIMEKGTNGAGLHMHVVIYYNGKHCHDIHYANEIADYWELVASEKLGEAWASNGDIERLENGPWGYAIGQVNRNDIVKRQKLQNYLVGYFCKNEQYVDDEEGRRFRSFGMSQIE